MLTSETIMKTAPFMKGKHVLLALSGGADSIALFHLLKELADKGALTLTCAHFEHGIRKTSSERDMRFVESLCKAHGVCIYAERADVPYRAALSGEGLETCARRLRHDFLRRVKNACGADMIALAHHRDDRAETVLMHLLRGGGLAGASGMKKQEGVLIRPLLDINKEDLIRFLNAKGLSWCEDETNLENDNPRNLLRNCAIPELERAYPGAKNALCRFSEIAQAENEYMEREVKRYLSDHVSFYAGVARLSLCPMPDTAILRRAVKSLFPFFTYEDVERARNAGRGVNLSSGCYAEKTGKELFLRPPLDVPEPVNISGEGAYTLEGVCLMTAGFTKAKVIKNDPYTQVVSVDSVEGTCLRTRRDCDRMCPLGMRGRSKLLSDILTDKKIPKPLRDRMPVLARGDEILWAAGAGISDKIKIENQTDAVRLKITINTENGGNTNEK